MRPTTRHSFAVLLLLAVLSTMVLATPALADDGQGAEQSIGSLEQLFSSLLDWLGLGGDQEESQDDEDPPLPSMGFEIEPNG